MMTKQKNLLVVTTCGSYPDLDAVYKQQGYKASTAKTLRKALAMIKQLSPEVVVAEFVYAPTYGSQLSNFESLFAAAQTYSPEACFIALTHKEDLHHIEQIKSQFKCCIVVTLPVSTTHISNCLQSITQK